MEYAIFRLSIRVLLFVLALTACVIYLIQKRKFLFLLFFNKKALKNEYTGRNDVKILRISNLVLIAVSIFLIFYLSEFGLDIPNIIKKQYSYAEGYAAEKAHGGADAVSERRSVFLHDRVSDKRIEIIVFSGYIDENTYLKIQYLPHTKYGAILGDP